VLLDEASEIKPQPPPYSVWKIVFMKALEPSSVTRQLKDCTVHTGGGGGDKIMETQINLGMEFFCVG
jgi:hypothetical protein